MRLSEIKGEEAFKTAGKIIGLLREMFQDKELSQIVAEEEQGWILNFFSTSLEKKSDIWLTMFLALNPDKSRDDVSLSSVITFAYEFKNDPELMSLFFSQSEQTVNNSSGSHTETTKATEQK